MSAAPPVACTAIVPTLDRERDLLACLDSLVAARPPYAAVLVADQGADLTRGERVAARGARWLHQSRRGLSRARNAALADVRTPWVHFPDDDATVPADVLAQLADVLARHPRAAFVAAKVVSPEGAPIMAGMDHRERALDEPVDLLRTVMSPGLFVAARVFERCGGFDESFGVGAEWPSGEESDLLFRVLDSGEHGVYAPTVRVTHPAPFEVRETAEQLRRARLYGRGWGALFAKHARGPRGATFAALQRRYEWRALGGCARAAATGRWGEARRYAESWRGRREGWRGWRAENGAGV